jgi:hypothetical protein
MELLFPLESPIQFFLFSPNAVFLVEHLSLAEVDLGGLDKLGLEP